MPLYEYECDACGHRFEKIQKFSDPLEKTCPTCGGAVHKLMSSPAIQFKGSGFYITDYPKGDKSTAPKSDGGKKAASEKADAAPAKSESTASSSDSSSSSTSATPAAAAAAAPASTPSTTTKAKD
jgi:putative FmdB family regulatory protein